MDIKSEEYVRTHNGRIYIISYYSEEEKRYISVTEDDWYPVYESEIKSHSENILDLIEVRDFINGLRILDLERKEDTIFACIAKVGVKEIWRTFYKEDIIDIVTKEQFEREKYIVGG